MAYPGHIPVLVYAIQVVGLVNEDMLTHVAAYLMAGRNANVVNVVFDKAGFRHANARHAIVRIDHEQIANGPNAPNCALVFDGEEPDSAALKGVSNHYVHVVLERGRYGIAAVLIRHAHEIEKWHVACGAAEVRVDEPRTVEVRVFAHGPRERVVHLLPFLEEVVELGRDGIESAHNETSLEVRDSRGEPIIHHGGISANIAWDLVDEVLAVGEKPYVLLEGGNLPCRVPCRVQGKRVHEVDGGSASAVVDGVAVAQQHVVLAMNHHRERP